MVDDKPNSIGSLFIVKKGILQFAICFLYSVLTTAVTAQKIDHLVSFRTIESESYFRFHYDNDFFAATDENYTQGYNFEFVSPVFEKNPLNAIFFTSEEFATIYGLSLEHIGFTPNRYELPEIQFGDRPFAAAIMLKSFAVSIHPKKKLRWHSSLSFGLIGPGAFGEEMQTGIHEWTGNKEPLGWRHQIENDVVLNYNFGIEKQIINMGNLFAVQAQSNLQIGTLFTNISAGANMMVGKFNNPFTSEAKNKRFQFYAYAQPIVRFIGYDATLQGGLINVDSPYTISSGEVERATAQFNFGIIIQTKTLYFEYSRSGISREFEAGATANWGGFRLGFTF